MIRAKFSELQRTWDNERRNRPGALVISSDTVQQLTCVKKDHATGLMTFLRAVLDIFLILFYETVRMRTVEQTRPEKKR